MDNIKVFDGSGRRPINPVKNDNIIGVIEDRPINPIKNDNVLAGDEEKVVNNSDNIIRIFDGVERHPINYIKNDNILMGVTAKILKEIFSVDSTLNSESARPLQNKAIYNIINEIYQSLDSQISYRVISEE